MTIKEFKKLLRFLPSKAEIVEINKNFLIISLNDYNMKIDFPSEETEEKSKNIID